MNVGHPTLLLWLVPLTGVVLLAMDYAGAELLLGLTRLRRLPV